MDISEIARSCGASLERHATTGDLHWWRFSLDELQLFAGKIQQAEREKYAYVLAALEACRDAMEYMSEYDIPINLPKQVKDAIAMAKGGV